MVDILVYLKDEFRKILDYDVEFYYYLGFIELILKMYILYLLDLYLNIIFVKYKLLENVILFFFIYENENNIIYFLWLGEVRDGYIMFLILVNVVKMFDYFFYIFFEFVRYEVKINIFVLYRFV